MEAKTNSDAMKLLFVSVLLSAFVGADPLHPSIARNLNKVVFVYPSGVQSERDLPGCPENSACSIVHKRFWLPPIVERLCKCSRRHDCRWTWTAEPDNYTMALDNRSQIKFCEELQLPTCGVKRPALKVVLHKGGSTLQRVTPRGRNPQKPIREAAARNLTAVCNCQEPHYWKLKQNTTRYDEETEGLHQAYYCSKLRKCVAREFCGYVRTDTHATFYRCSCPDGHLCITRDRSVHNVEELLYSGQGYKAFCLPVKKKNRTRAGAQNRPRE